MTIKDKYSPWQWHESMYNIYIEVSCMNNYKPLTILERLFLRVLVFYGVKYIACSIRQIDLSEYIDHLLQLSYMHDKIVHVCICISYYAGISYMLNAY